MQLPMDTSTAFSAALISPCKGARSDFVVLSAGMRLVGALVSQVSLLLAHASLVELQFAVRPVRATRAST